MATSGTIDRTVIPTDVVLAHAMRRCGVAASGQTPEIVEIAQECLFFLMLALTGRGVNLWCVDKKIIDVELGQKTYVLPPGTLSLLNVAFSQATYVTGTNTATATSYKVALTTATAVVRVGVTFSVLPTTAITFDYSDDGSIWVTAQTVNLIDFPAVNTIAWYDMNICGSHAYYRVYAAGGAFTATELLLCGTINDLPITGMNRDDYTALPNKNSPGNPAVNYFFEKLTNPQITLWPVPNVAGNQFCIWRHRQIQDVGSLTQQLDIPNRWYEDVIWQLARSLMFELPAGVADATRMQAVLGMADTAQITVEAGENDGAPTFYAPGIGVYTK